MALVEIVRYVDVYEADLAAAFLESSGIRVTVADRFQTTLDPLMQRALGVRLMVRASDADPDDLPRITTGVRTAGTILALAVFATGSFWGNGLPRRFRPFPWQGMVISLAGLMLVFAILWAAAGLILDPP